MESKNKEIERDFKEDIKKLIEINPELFFDLKTYIKNKKRK